MTKKAHRQRDGLLAPRRVRAAKPLEQRYGHVLDAALEDIMPQHRPAPRDEPDQPADHLLKKSELYKSLEAMFLFALARAGAFNSDEDGPDYSALAEEANLTLGEYEAVAMTLDGHSREQIAKWQHLSVDAVDSARRRGVQKLRKFILISGATAFGHSVLRDHLGGDEA